MKIVIDNREHTLIKLITALNNDYEYKLNIEVQKLDLGDISIQNDDGEELLLIERKNLADLASSIRDGRYNEQSYRLNGMPIHNHNIVYLIEGNMSHYNQKYTRIKPETLYVTMLKLQYYKGFSVFRTMDITETAEYILRSADKMRREKSVYGFYHENFTPTIKTYTNVVKKVKKQNIVPENIGSVILSQIPGISAKTSEVIMKEFGSLLNLLKTLENDRKCLDKICYTTSSGQQRRISQKSIQNIIQYLLYQKTSVITIE
jgi:ERCC4-type nuclease